MFFCECCKTFKNTYFEEHVKTAVSVYNIQDIAITLIRAGNSKSRLLSVFLKKAYLTATVFYRNTGKL